MDLERIHKKLAEAQFFLGKMTEQEHWNRTFGDRQLAFDFYLSAFLNAGRTVDYRLRYEQQASYKAWRKAWDARLTPEENSLIKFMVDDRIDEVHKSGSSRSEAKESVRFGIGAHHRDRGRITVSGLPGMPPNLIDKPIYNFTIDGAERRATEACAAYLALLRRMVVQFAEFIDGSRPGDSDTPRDPY